MNSKNVFISGGAGVKKRELVSFTFLFDEYEAETRVNSLYELRS